MADFSANLSEAWNLDEPMTEGEQALRDMFVNEYLKDFDAYRAAIRCGFLATHAIEWCKRLMGETYVQRMITQLTAPNEDDLKQAEQDRLANMQRLRQIRDDPMSKPLERASAIKELNAMRGFNKPAASETDEHEALVDIMKEFASKAPA